MKTNNMRTTKRFVLFITFMMIVLIMLDDVNGAPPLRIKTQKMNNVEATGALTIVNFRNPNVNGGEPPYSISNDAPANGFSLGQHLVNWMVTDNVNAIATDIQSVTIVDTRPPTIKVLGSNPITINVGDVYKDAGATAKDIVDGDLTSKIVVNNFVNINIAGTYTITYDVSDFSGNIAEQTRTVNVVNVGTDTIPPVITLFGSNPETINVGDVYKDAGATAIDNFDGDITSSIVTVNSVNTAIAGTYNVTYDVSDKAGNPAHAERTINVVQPRDKLVIISYSPNSSVEDTAPSHITYNITTNYPASIKWILNGAIKQNIPSSTQDSYNGEIANIGSYTLVATATNGSESVSQSWNWNIMGLFEVQQSTNNVNIGQPTNITFKVDRSCGIEVGDNCTGRIPVVGANVDITGMSTPVNGVTNDTGIFVATINVSTNGTINVTTSKSGYISNYSRIMAGFANSITTPNAGSSSGSSSSSSSSSSSGVSSGGGGGGGAITGEPYNNVLKHEIQENFISANVPVSFKFSTPDLIIYEVVVKGNQSDDLTLNVELLKNTSVLVGTPPPGNVYKNLNIWANSKRINNATIRYKVENSWLSNNGLSASDVKLQRWDNNSRKWLELSTKTISNPNNDSKYTYFEAETTGFSSFAVNAQKQKNNILGTTDPTIDKSTASVSNTVDALGNRKQPIAFEAIVSSTIIGLTIYLLRMRKENKETDGNKGQTKENNEIDEGINLKNK